MTFDDTSVQHALAQFAGSGGINGYGSRGLVVAVSFGWILYPFYALSSLLGTGRLMPVADVDSMVINAKTGYARKNKSWIIGRFLRDWDFKPTTTRGLYITVLDAAKEKENYSNVHRSSLYQLVMLTDAIDGFPLLLPKDASHAINVVLSAAVLLTVFISVHSYAQPKVETLLQMIVLFTGMAGIFMIVQLPQWQAEKFNCRNQTKQTYCVTSGNGSQHVLIVRGNGVGLNLEDLASNRAPKTERRTIITVLLCCLASFLTIYLIALQSLDSYMFVTLFLGSCQNILAAQAPQSAASLGFHVKEVKKIHDNNVIKALALAEEDVEGAGFTLLPVFFPGKTRAEDLKVLEEAKAKRESKDNSAEKDESVGNDKSLKKEASPEWEKVVADDSVL